MLENLSDLLHWLQQSGWMAIIWLIVFQALMEVSLIPGPYFTMAAGFLFGIVGGGAIAWVGATLGATIAYGIGYGLAGPKFQIWVHKFPWVPTLEKFLEKGGWKVVLSTRLLPLFPFKLSNYFFGSIKYPFLPFFIGTVIGILPSTMVSVAAGTLAANLTDLLDPKINLSPTKWILPALGLIIALAIFWYTGRKIKNEMKTKIESDLQ